MGIYTNERTASRDWVPLMSGKQKETKYQNKKLPQKQHGWWGGKKTMRKNNAYSTTHVQKTPTICVLFVNPIQPTNQPTRYTRAHVAWRGVAWHGVT